MLKCCFGGDSSGGAGGRAKSGGGAGVARNSGAESEALPSLPGCELLCLLGQGTFGTVVLIRERATKALFALKIMSKEQLMADGQVENVVTERQVLRDAGPHPFVIECFGGFQTDTAVVLVLEYLSGGDFYDLLKERGLLDEAQARFYLAEIVMGIGELHAHKFALRDLKLENILLDGDGHTRLTDFGLAGKVSALGDTSIVDLSGTAIYQAPEILAKKGHGTAVDWWALGVLAFLMMSGRPPFNAADRTELYRMIQDKELNVNEARNAEKWSSETKDLLRRLLDKNPETRLGAKGVQEVMAHDFFRNVQWDRVLSMEVTPPLPPPKSMPEEAEHAEAVRAAKQELKKRLQVASKNRKGVYQVMAEFERVHVRSRESIGLDFDNTRPPDAVQHKKTFKSSALVH
mmetsp:Transcript_10622/g.28313  ORF Transcript_10622/g.28313 Transcript_10622/m.28313 type:complete len:404 (-) Transcript_10622:158-1369(-)